MASSTFDLRYGVDKIGPALSEHYNRGGRDHHQGGLPVDLALLRNDTELQALVGTALKIRGLRWPQPAPGRSLRRSGQDPLAAAPVSNAIS
jgi:hypothetical protein